MSVLKDVYTFATLFSVYEYYVEFNIILYEGCFYSATHLYHTPVIVVGRHMNICTYVRHNLPNDNLYFYTPYPTTNICIQCKSGLLVYFKCCITKLSVVLGLVSTYVRT